MTLNQLESKGGKVNKKYNHNTDLMITNSLVHDLATPISAAKAFLYILESNQVDDMNSDVYRTVKASIESAEGMLENTRSLQINNLKISKFKLEKCIERILSVAHHKAEKSNISLLMDIDSGLVIATCQNLLERVLLNLINNAIDAFDDGAINKKIGISAQSVSSKITICISDNGKGIPGNTFHKIFQRGYSSKKGHSGIGLTYVKSNVETRLKGKLVIKSTQGEGTQIFVILPKSLSH